MKKLIHVVLFLYILTLNVYSQERAANVPSYPNELIEYSLSYGVFHVGTAHIEYKSKRNCGGAHIEAQLKTGGWAKVFKDVKYRFESCMDTLTGLPIVARREIIEKDFVDLNEVSYYYTLREDSSLIYSKNTDSLVVPLNIFDIVTGFYHYRSNIMHDSMEMGQIDTVTTFFVDEVWDLVMRYVGKETVETDIGEIKCLKFMPRTSVSRFFSGNDDLILWVTDNKLHVPVKMYVNFKIGSLTATIKKYKKPRGSIRPRKSLD